MRLIDADELKANVLKWLPPDPCGREEKEFPFETDICVSMLQEIEEAVTVDAVPVVRCKDCKFSKPINAMVIECTIWADARLKADFCSAGERKERDQT